VIAAGQAERSTMQPRLPAQFEREHGCTVSEWLGWLPGAVGGHALELGAPGEGRVSIGAGYLHLQWQALPPRQIALIRMPRLQVSYRFDAVSDADRAAFMRYFDLYMQRGGG
jgi:hypothetical protein